jgi:hypothetical protein
MAPESHDEKSIDGAHEREREREPWQYEYVRQRGGSWTQQLSPDAVSPGTSQQPADRPIHPTHPEPWMEQATEQNVGPSLYHCLINRNFLKHDAFLCNCVSFSSLRGVQK